MWNDISKDLK